MITIEIGQVVYTNTAYITDQSGTFGHFDYVLCRSKFDTQPSTCTFFAYQVAGVNIQENIEE